MSGALLVLPYKRTFLLIELSGFIGHEASNVKDRNGAISKNRTLH
jgi:hypothetical protein